MTEAQAAEIIGLLDAINFVLGIVAGTVIGFVICVGLEYFKRLR